MKRSLLSIILLMTFAAWTLQDIPGCDKVDPMDKDNCQDCKDSYYKTKSEKQTDNGSKTVFLCSKCNLTCKTCVDKPTKCTSCDPMFKLNSDKHSCQATQSTIIKISLIGFYLLVIISLAFAFCIGVIWAVNTSTATPYKKVMRASMIESAQYIEPVQM